METAMQRSRWLIGAIASLLGALALGQVPGTIPPIKLPPTKLPAKPVPGMAEAIEAQEPFIARYAYCNAMQLYQSRRAAWEPIYRDAGASSADLDAYSGDLVTYFKEFCSNGRPAHFWQAALARVEAFDNRVDAAMAASLGIGLQDATQLRISRLLVQLEKLREGCLGGDEAAVAEDQMSVFGSLLPATSAPPGLTLDPKSPAASLGKCSKGGGFGGGGLPGPGLDRSTLSACIADALAQSGSCASPIGDDPGGDVVRREDFGAGCATVGRANICHSTERRVYANGGYVDVTSSRITNIGKDGREHEIRIDRRRTIGTNHEVVSDYSQTFVDGKHVQRGRSEATDDRARRIREDITAGAGDLPLRVPRGFEAVTQHFVSPNRTVEMHTRRIESTGGSTTRPSRTDNCAAVNPGSSQPLGFARTESSDGGRGNPVHAGRLDTWDMVGQCVCDSLGRLGPGLAANSGFSCGPDENTERLDCLLNPSGPADGIRPECVEFLHADNPDRDSPRALNEWCGRVAQCPPGAGIATTSGSGGAMCSCGTGLATPRGGSGSTPGGGRCAAVSCAGGAGAAGSDLYPQCCGAPGELPVTVDPTPGSPVPRPPDPGQLPKKPMPEMPKQPLPPN
jgi:hypothetical protein